MADYFEIVSGPSHFTRDAKGGDYPLIGASKYNNGIVGWMETYDFDEGYYTLVKDGSSIGIIIKQEQKFNKVPTVYVLRKIKPLNDDLLNFISLQLNMMFSWTNKLTVEKYKTIVIYIYK